MPTSIGKDVGMNADGGESVDASEVKTSKSNPLFLQKSEAHVWNEINEKQLRSALIGACKRMPRNAEAYFHLGLMYMRKCDGEEALRSFEHCKQIYNERLEALKTQGVASPPHLLSNIARLRCHTAQAAYLATVLKFTREERVPYIGRLQRDLVASTNLDGTQPDAWNALGLLHLTECGFQGARDVLCAISKYFPQYLDALNNLGLCELALGNEKVAVNCFQQVALCDKDHAEALSNYGIVLLRNGLYETAIRTFEGAVNGSSAEGRGLAFAWGGLAVARAAVGMLAEAEEAACIAERTADPVNKAKFSMLMTSVCARRATAELRRGLTSWVRTTPSSEEQDSRWFQAHSNLKQNPSRPVTDPRPAIDGAVLRLRALAREIKSSSSSTALGNVLRLRHEYSWEESGNRNYGSEAAERLVEALEMDDTDTPAWVQLSLLQMGHGDYVAAREFASQAVSREGELEAGWNAMAVVSQLTDNVSTAQEEYEKAIELVKSNYSKRRGRYAPVDGLSGKSADTLEPKAEDELLALDELEGFHRADEANSNRDSKVVKPSLDQSRSASVVDGDHLDEPEKLISELNEAGLSALAALYNNLGNLKRQESRSFSDALSAYNTSLKFGGESAVVYNNLGLLYISVDRFDDASRMLEHALKLDPQLECAVSNRLKLHVLMRKKDRDGFEKDESGHLDNDDVE